MSGRKPFDQTLTRGWWLKRSGYKQYMVRESTSAFVLLFSLELYIALFCLVRGEQAWQSFLQAVQSPWLIVLNFIFLAAVLWHLVTWFQLTPKTMPTRIAGKAVTEKSVMITLYGLFAAVSVLVIIVLTGGF